MAKPSAFRILTVLSNVERKKLLNYLQTKFFSNRKELAPLQQAWQRMQGKPMNEEKLFQAALPKKPFKKRDWYLLLSRLQDATEDFLGIQRYREDQMQQQLQVLRAYRRLKLPVFFERSLRQARKFRQKEQRAEAEMLLWDYQTESEYYNFIAAPEAGQESNLQAVTDRLDYYFIAEKLRQACLAHGRYLANEEEYEIRYLDTILDDLEARPDLFKVPAIVLYATCYQAVVAGGDEQDFLRLRKVLELFRGRFPTAEIRDVYRLAIDACLRQVHLGKKAFIAETQALYQDSLTGGYLLVDDHLLPEAFTNIVGLGLQLANYDGVATFIQTYTNELPGPDREPVTNYNIARLLHAQEAYAPALKALEQVDTQEPFLYIDVRSLQVQIFVELQEWGTVEKMTVHLVTYLQRQEKLGRRAEDFSLFLYFCRRLQQLKPDDTTEAISLQLEIEETPSFAEKEWLLGKLK